MTTWASSSSWTITSTVGVVYSIWIRYAEVAQSDLLIRRYLRRRTDAGSGEDDCLVRRFGGSRLSGLIPETTFDGRLQ
jgi:hypothetical protein